MQVTKEVKLKFFQEVAEFILSILLNCGGEPNRKVVDKIIKIIPPR